MRAPTPPTACSLGGRNRRASPRLRTGTTHGPRPGAAREQEPEQYGGHALHDLSVANDSRFVARLGKAEGRTEAEQPPAPLGPPATLPRRAAHRPPPPPPRQADPLAAGRDRRQGLPRDPGRTPTRGGDAPATKGGLGREVENNCAILPPPLSPHSPPPTRGARGRRPPTPPKAEGMVPPPPGSTAAPGAGGGSRARLHAPSRLLPQEPRRTSKPALCCLPREGSGTDRGKATPRRTGPPGRTTEVDGAQAAPRPLTPGVGTPQTRRPNPRRAHSPMPGNGETGPGLPPPESKPNGAWDRGRTRGEARTEWNALTSAQHRDHARCARHTNLGSGGGGGVKAARARGHRHTKDTRGIPEGQPDRARGKHRPHGMAYQRVRIRDTPPGWPATQSAGNAAREGGETGRHNTRHQP